MALPVTDFPITDVHTGDALEDLAPADADFLDVADASDITDITDVIAVPVPDDTRTGATEVLAPAGRSARPTLNRPGAFWQRRIYVGPVSLVLAVLLVATGCSATWLYAQYYRPDQQTSHAVRRAAIDAATDGTVALLSYSSDTLEQDFAAARSYLSGDFLSYYKQFTQQIVMPSATQKSLKTSARVVRAAAQELYPTSAVVLLFVDQSTTDNDDSTPAMEARSVVVNLALIDGKWLITKFTPV
ncbi:hypothetical protein [Mycobacterium sp.]|uniref:hypothetical protein n=1 Tax=Mycobacterium sp. TaxID=1785 RepID=UPI003A87AE5A